MTTSNKLDMTNAAAQKALHYYMAQDEAHGSNDIMAYLGIGDRAWTRFQLKEGCKRVVQNYSYFDPKLNRYGEHSEQHLEFKTPEELTAFILRWS